MSTPNQPTTGATWLSTAQAGAALGISARAVQKRCAAGTLSARRVPIPGGFRWEVEASEIEGGTREPQGGTSEPKRAEPANSDAQKAANVVRSLGTMQGGTRELGSERETELKAEITFLRGIVESDRRDMAELRAALREALKLAPKQLTAGQSSTTDATSINRPQRAESADLGNHSPEAAKGRKRPQNAPKSALTYGDIADELERRMNGGRN